MHRRNVSIDIGAGTRDFLRPSRNILQEPVKYQRIIARAQNLLLLLK